MFYCLLESSSPSFVVRISYYIVACVGCLAKSLLLLRVTQSLPSNGGFSCSPILALANVPQYYIAQYTSLCTTIQGIVTQCHRMQQTKF
jgi:hypothetical protein